MCDRQSTHRGMSVRSPCWLRNNVWMGDAQLPHDVEHVFTAEDREAQLVDFDLLCERLADAFAAHDDPRAAELFRARAAGARRLQVEGFSQADLNELGGPFPAGAWWLNPKAADYNAPREPWQDDVAVLHRLASATASDLRAIATLYRP
jgi:hypothetical protein